jgi:hypothetical protein
MFEAIGMSFGMGTIYIHVLINQYLPKSLKLILFYFISHTNMTINGVAWDNTVFW